LSPKLALNSLITLSLQMFFLSLFKDVFVLVFVVLLFLPFYLWQNKAVPSFPKNRVPKTIFFKSDLSIKNVNFLIESLVLKMKAKKMNTNMLWFGLEMSL
jgi:hypothetical protein